MVIRIKLALLKASLPIMPISSYNRDGRQVVSLLPAGNSQFPCDQPHNQQIMTQQRKNQILEEFRRPTGTKSSRSKEIKSRLHHIRPKETFLTDTQTSDYTKSSGEIRPPRPEHLEQTIRKLQRENTELKQRIVELKTNQFFEINEEKLKTIIKETDRLRQDLEKAKKDLEQSLIERDFLERFNRNLKAQCETLTKQILQLRGTPNDNKKNEKNIYTSREESESNRSRNSSNELVVVNKRKDTTQSKKEESSVLSSSRNLLKNSLSTSRLHEDYYPSRASRQKPYNYY